MKLTSIPIILCFAPFIWAENGPTLRGVFDKISTSLKPLPHIVGGKEVEPHSHPYAVNLRFKTYQGQSYRCGGALLSSKWIISAAHCANNKVGTAVAYMGGHDLRNQEPMRKAHYVSDIITHPGWASPHVTDDDLALLALDVPVELSEFVQPIRLPSLKQSNKSFWRYTATMLGWGKTGDNLGPSPVLLSVETNIVTNLYCKFKYGWSVIKDIHICSDGSNQRAACTGDSGGPLAVTDDDGNRTLIGVTSFGTSQGCERSFPNVFTRVTNYLEWISKTTGIVLRE